MHRLLRAISFTCLVVLGSGSTLPTGAAEPPQYTDGSGVTFEQVGPSTWRVEERAWDCDERFPRQPFYEGAQWTPDGRLWFIDRTRGIRELGSCPILEPALPFGIRDHAVGPDGTIWVLEGDRLSSWDGAAWVIHAEDRFNQPGCTAIGIGPATPAEVNEHGGECYTDCDLTPCVLSVDIAPDGTAWLSGTVLSAYDGLGWTDYAEDRAGILVVGFGEYGSLWYRDGAGDLYVLQP